MIRAFTQGELDSLCGMYAIVNAEKLINNSSIEESQELFNSIIRYLSRKRILRDIIIEGTNHKVMTSVMRDVIQDKISLQITNRKNFNKLGEWWSYSKKFLDGGSNRAIILSLGGKRPHLTVIREMSDRRMILIDSNWSVYIKKNDCRLPDYLKEDRHVVYPSQCWYLSKENPY